MGMPTDTDGGGPVANINVTPLVDVMLVLLIIFMVTAPMLQQGVEVNLPKATTAPLKGDSEQVVLSINAVGDVFLGKGNQVELGALAEKVKAVMAARPINEQKIYIQADTDLEYGRIMEVMGELHKGGVSQIGLVSDPMNEPKSRDKSKKKKN